MPRMVNVKTKRCGLKRAAPEERHAAWKGRKARISAASTPRRDMGNIMSVWKRKAPGKRAGGSASGISRRVSKGETRAVGRGLYPRRCHGAVVKIAVVCAWPMYHALADRRCLCMAHVPRLAGRRNSLEEDTREGRKEGRE